MIMDHSTPNDRPDDIFNFNININSFEPNWSLFSMNKPEELSKLIITDHVEHMRWIYNVFIIIYLFIK